MSTTFSAASRVSTSSRLSRSCASRQRLAQALARVGQAGVEGDGRELGEQAPAVVARGALVQRALEVGRGGVRRAVLRGVGRGARAAAR